MQTNRRRYSPRAVNGILLLDKPKGLSSNQALQKAKHLFQAKKAGHTGSLDPLATGMLPICFGEATKFSYFLLDADKSYQTTAKLGVATETGDAEGAIIETQAVPVLSETIIKSVLAQFIGEISQTPPMYSALKHEGQPLYQLARRGITIERKKRNVIIHEIQLLDFTADTLTLQVHCSKGTYIRTLVEDIAKSLHTVAHVQELRRLWTAPFESYQQYSLSELTELVSLEKLDQLLLPMDLALSALPVITVAYSSDVKKLQQGQPVDVPLSTPDQFARIYSDENIFLGTGEVKEGRLCPRRMVNF